MPRLCLKEWLEERVTLLKRGSVEIATESWDIAALLILLRIIHCQNDNIPRRLSLELLAKVAVLSDYLQGYFDQYMGLCFRRKRSHNVLSRLSNMEGFNL